MVSLLSSKNRSNLVDPDQICSETQWNAFQSGTIQTREGSLSVDIIEIAQSLIAHQPHQSSSLSFFGEKAGKKERQKSGRMTKKGESVIFSASFSNSCDGSFTQLRLDRLERFKRTCWWAIKRRRQWSCFTLISDVFFSLLHSVWCPFKTV